MKMSGSSAESTTYNTFSNPSHVIASRRRFGSGPAGDTSITAPWMLDSVKSGSIRDLDQELGSPSGSSTPHGGVRVTTSRMEWSSSGASASSVTKHKRFSASRKFDDSLSTKRTEPTHRHHPPNWDPYAYGADDLLDDEDDFFDEEGAYYHPRSPSKPALVHTPQPDIELDERPNVGGGWGRDRHSGEDVEARAETVQRARGDTISTQPSTVGGLVDADHTRSSPEVHLHLRRPDRQDAASDAGSGSVMVIE